MAKQTSTQTYRVSDEVDTELRRLAKIHGGIDKALRQILNIQPRDSLYAMSTTDNGITLTGSAPVRKIARTVRQKGDAKR